MKNILFAAVAMIAFKAVAAENAMAPYQGDYKVASCTEGKKQKPCEVKMMRIYLVYDVMEFNPFYVWGSRPFAMKKDASNDFKYSNYHATATFSPNADGSLSLKIDDYIPSSYVLIKK